MQRVIDGLVTGSGRIAPGVTAYVAGARGVWAGSAGIATIGTPMQPDARLRLNSMGKTWTATLILKLVGEGRMKLDDTVSHWLPGLLPYGNQITVEQLLNMTSGMIDTNDFNAKPAYYLSKIKDPALRARVLAAARRGRTEPTYPPTHVWIEAAAGAATALPAREHLALLEHRLHGRRADRGTGRRRGPRNALPYADHRSAAPAERTL